MQADTEHCEEAEVERDRGTVQRLGHFEAAVDLHRMPRLDVDNRLFGDGFAGEMLGHDRCSR